MGRSLRTSNQWERIAVSKLYAEGYQVIKSGWPDFLAVQNDTIRLIEVKPPGSVGLKEKQIEVARILLRVGLNTEVWRGGEPTEQSAIWRLDNPCLNI